MSLRNAIRVQALRENTWAHNRRLWGARTSRFLKGVRQTTDPRRGGVPGRKPASVIVGGTERLPSGGRGYLRAAAAPVQKGVCRASLGIREERLRWLVIGLLAAVVFIELLKPSPLCYLVIPLGFPFAFLTPANALATYIITILVPCAFGNLDIAARLPVLLLAPLAYHAVVNINRPRHAFQRILLVLQAVLCLTVLVLAFATETLSQINESANIYVGPLALLLASLPLWTMSDRRFLFRVFALGGVIVASKTLLRFASHAPAFAADGEDTLRGTLDKLDPNYTSCYIGFGLICALYLLMETLGGKQKRWTALVWLGQVTISMVAMGLLASRGMALALILGLAVLMATIRVKLLTRLAVSALVLLVGLAVATAGGFDLLWARFHKEDLRTGNRRTDINAMALRFFAERPVDQQLFGAGGNSSLRGIGWHTHNAFTEQLMDHGIVGTACFVGLFLCLGTACLCAGAPARASGLALLCFTAVASMSVSPFMYAWGWVALACILPCRKDDGPALTRRNRA